jgi:hypothetical protein
MRSFLIAWLVAFCLVAVVASTVSWYVNRVTPSQPTVEIRRQAISFESDPTTSPPFPEADAIETVALRLPTDASGDLYRKQLQNDSTVTYHSAQHWRVCFDNACWIAHGPGRYAEPENDAAQQREGRSSAAP